MADIRLYNSKTRKVEDFTPIDEKNVRMYVCGPTVYDRAHLGNARPVVVFDVLFRLLRHVYGEDHVRYVRNFTDVDDKINARAADTRAEGETEIEAIKRITDETIGWFWEDMGALGALPPTESPRATDFIEEMVSMIEELARNGFAYHAEGHVLFRVRRYKEYGALSGRSVDDMISGARVEVAPYKEDPLDFVLWKPSSDNEPGWDGPVIDGEQVGRGRPGWHIECSAMADELLMKDLPEAEKSFDIHGGGGDLQFPHHENEIAQSCCAHPEGDFAKVWMHNEMLQVEGKKMSKSLGNFFTVRDLLDGGPGNHNMHEEPPRKRITGEVIRHVLLSTHYRKPMDWTEQKVQIARSHLVKWHQFKRKALSREICPEEVRDLVDAEIIAALANDLNTPLALAHLSKLFGLAFSSRTVDSADSRRFYASLQFLGFADLDPDRIEKNASVYRAIDTVLMVNTWIEALKLARADKNWQKADIIKSALTDSGIRLQITKTDVEWEQIGKFDPSKLEALK